MNDWNKGNSYKNNGLEIWVVDDTQRLRTEKRCLIMQIMGVFKTYLFHLLSNIKKTLHSSPAAFILSTDALLETCNEGKSKEEAQPVKLTYDFMNFGSLFLRNATKNLCPVRKLSTTVMRTVPLSLNSYYHFRILLTNFWCVPFGLANYQNLRFFWKEFTWQIYF